MLSADPTNSPRTTGTTFLPYGKQYITNEDVQAVVKVLKSAWLTQGPMVPAFENKIAEYIGAPNVVACVNGTAALHLAIRAAEVGEGDEVVTTPNTFLASANCARYVGAEARFADIDATTGLMDPQSLANVLEADHRNRIKVVIPVHFAGQPVDMAHVHTLAKAHGALIVDDACHALGAEYDYKNRTYRLGSSPHADMTVFSFHPIKHVAMGEGGAIATANDELAERLRCFRNHGMKKEDFVQSDMALSQDGSPNPWYYEMQELGFNYRVTDMQAALGISQLARLPWSLERRSHIAAFYRQLLSRYIDSNAVRPLTVLPDRKHAYHLFVVQIDFERFGVCRADVMNTLKEAGIGTQVHYIPIHLQPYYRMRYGTAPGDFPQAERYYARALSLPMYPDLTEADCERVIGALKTALEGRK